MAKALLGHLGGPDPRLLAELTDLRRRVRDLESEVLRLAAENQALVGVRHELIDLEPADAVELPAPVLA